MNSTSSAATETEKSGASAETLKVYAYDLLRKAIVSGAYKPGSRMNESQLSRELNISRIPIREALLQLQGQGLVTNHPRRGMFVTELTAADVSRINSLRVVLEAEALRVCRNHMTRPLAASLTRLVERMERWDERSNIDAANLDLDFHRAIWRAADNPYLFDTLDALTTVLFAFTALDKVSHDDQHWRLNHHRDLLNFVLGHSEQAAESVVIDHLSRYYEEPAAFSSFSAPRLRPVASAKPGKGAA